MNYKLFSKTAIDLVYTGNIKKMIDIETNFPKSKIIALVNKLEIEQVFVNLLKNAADSLTEHKVGEGKIKISMTRNNESNCTEVTVTDNGPGIPQDIQDEIFNPFFTTKKIGKGTGLGLSITHKLVEKHQGKLFLKESKGSGATFVLQLPILEMGNFALNEQFLHELADTKMKKILVVDDEVEILNVMDGFIREAGHVLVGSTGGEDALRVLQQLEFDLVITDYDMPEMNGTELSKRIREIDQNIPILYLTSSDKMKFFQEDKEPLKIAGLVIKPFTREDINSIINKVLGKEE